MSDWRDEAVCRHYDPEIMFPTGSPQTEARAALAEVALSLCSVCPVVQQCLRMARQMGATDGVFGGIDLGSFPPSRHGTKLRKAALEAATSEEVPV